MRRGRGSRSPLGKRRWNFASKLGGLKTPTEQRVQKEGANRVMGNGSNERKPGVNPVVDVEMMKRLRQRCLELTGQYPVVVQLAKAIKPEFQQLSERTLVAYASAAIKSTDYTFDLYISGKLPITVFVELAIGEYDKATQDFVAQKAVERKLSAAQISSIKGYRKRGDAWSDALKKVCGEIPPVLVTKDAKEAKKIIKSLEELPDEVNRLAMELMGLFSMAQEIAYNTTVDKGRYHYTLYKAAFLINNVAKETHEYFDRVLKKIYGNMVDFVTTEQELEEGRKAYDADRDQGQEGGEGGRGAGREEGEEEGEEVDRGVHEDRQQVPHPPEGSDAEGHA